MKRDVSAGRRGNRSSVTVAHLERQVSEAVGHQSAGVVTGSVPVGPRGCNQLRGDQVPPVELHAVEAGRLAAQVGHHAVLGVARVLGRLGLPRVVDAVRESLFQVAQPHAELGSLLRGDSRVDQRVRQELAALLDVHPALDGMGQHFGDDGQILLLGQRVAGLQERQVVEQVQDGLVLVLPTKLADVNWGK